jgi:hypothetical protein
MTAPTLAALAPINAAPELNAVAPVAAGALAPHESVNSADAQRFAQMLAVPSFTSSSGAAAPGSLLDAAQALGQELGHSRSLHEMRSSMLASVDLRDPIGTMFALTDHSLEAHARFARLHVSSGLASAATNLFGTLLKNQQ